MLTCYISGAGFNRAPDPAALGAAAWIDIESATPDEAAQVTQATGLRVPTLADLSEIESSSRLAQEGDALYLSMPWLVGVAGHAPRATVLGFVLTEARVLTIRFGDSQVIGNIVTRLSQPAAPSHSAGPHDTPMHLFATIIEAIVDRFADVLEDIGTRLDEVSNVIFHPPAATDRGTRYVDSQLREMLRQVGRAGDTVSRLRNSLLAVGRIAQYVENAAERWMPGDAHGRLRVVQQDVRSLSDHDNYLVSKIQFLQDAILGFINIAQNNVIKVLTVASVVGIPPTLFASIYGMNFKSMPELSWEWGYPYGLTVIVLSALVPLVWFRRRGWI